MAVPIDGWGRMLIQGQDLRCRSCGGSQDELARRGLPSAFHSARFGEGLRLQLEALCDLCWTWARPETLQARIHARRYLAGKQWV